MKNYHLVGPNEGKTIALGGFVFDQGKLAVIDKEVEAVEPIITRFYGAVSSDDYTKILHDRETAAKTAEAATATAKAEAEFKAAAEAKAAAAKAKEQK